MFQNDDREFQEVVLKNKLTVPTGGLIRVDTPTSRTRWYYGDCKEFDRLKSRHLFIREAHQTEYDPNESETLHPLFPSLWVLVRREDGGLHFRHAFWRGYKPFVSELSSDAATASVYAKCVEDGGVDDHAVKNWLKTRTTPGFEPS